MNHRYGMIKMILQLSFLAVLVSCSNCEDYTEPDLNVIFENYDDYDSYQDYTYFYGIGGRDTMHMTDILPLSINSDTSTFIIFNSELTDTLSISYHRKFIYSGENCGFSILLDSFKLLDRSTFDSVEFIVNESTQYYYSTSKRNEYQIIIYH